MRGGKKYVSSIARHRIILSNSARVVSFVWSECVCAVDLFYGRVTFDISFFLKKSWMLLDNLRYEINFQNLTFSLSLSLNLSIFFSLCEDNFFSVCVSTYVCNLIFFLLGGWEKTDRHRKYIYIFCLFSSTGNFKIRPRPRTCHLVTLHHHRYVPRPPPVSFLWLGF